MPESWQGKRHLRRSNRYALRRPRKKFPAAVPELQPGLISIGVDPPGRDVRSVAMPYENLMAEALAEARRARDAGEVPIGAIVAIHDEIVGRGFNQPIGSCDPTAHAEIVAIRAAARAAGNYRLS